jgi:hypothetical protein
MRLAAVGVPRFGSLTDTEPSMELIRLEILRRMTTTQRLALALEASCWLRELAVAGIRMRHPEATPQDVEHEYARIVLPQGAYRRLYSDYVQPADRRGLDH